MSQRKEETSRGQNPFVRARSPRKAPKIVRMAWHIAERTTQKPKTLAIVSLLCAFAVIAFPSLSPAQSNGCEGVIRQGIYDFFRDSDVGASSAQMRSEVQRAMERINQDRASGTVGVSYGMFGGSVSLSREQIESMNEAFTSDMSSSSAQSRNVDHQRQTISAVSVQAWRECMDRYADGLRVSSDIPDDPSAPVNFNVRYVAPPGQPQEISILPIQITPPEAFSCVWSVPGRGTVRANSTISVSNGNQIALDCTRQISAQPMTSGQRRLLAPPARITIQTNRGAVSRPFAGIPSVSQPPSSATILMAAFPRGVILPWYDREPPPSGWAVCNGEHGTPDLRNRVLLGAENVGQVGAIERGLLPAIGFDIRPLEVQTEANFSFGPARNNVPSGMGPAENSGWGRFHPGRHSGRTEAFHGQTVANSVTVIPPSVRVLYIMKL